MNLFELSAKLTLDKSEYESGLTDASEDASSFGSTLSSGLGTAGKVVGGALATVGTVAVATGKKVIDLVSDTAEYGDEVDKTSQKLGLSAEAYQEWDYVMNLAGTSMSNMGTGLKTLTNQIDEAKNGSTDAQDKFASLGISMSDLESMSREDIFEATIKGFQGMADSTDRAALANDLFGKSGQELTPLFNMTSEATDEAIQKAQDYGMVMSDDAVTASANFEDALTTLQTSLEGLGRTFASDLLPAITDAMDGIAKVINGDDSGFDQINDAITSFLDQIIDKTPDIVDSMGTLAEKLLDSVTDRIPDIIKMGTTVVKSLLKGILEYAPKLLKSVVSALKEAVPELIDGLGEMINTLVESLPDIIIAIIDAIPDIIEMLIESLISCSGDLISGCIKLIEVLVENLPKIIAELILAIPDIIVAIIEGFADLVDEFGKLFKQCVDAFPKIFSGIKDFGQNIMDDLVEGVSKKYDKWVDNTKKAREKINEVFKDIGDYYKSQYETATKNIETVWDTLEPYFKKARSNQQAVYKDIGEWFKSTFNDAKNGIEQAFDTGTFFQDVWDKITEPFSNAWDTFVEIGKNITNGIKAGIKQSWDDLWKTIEDKLTDIVDKVKSKLGIKSPSKVFKQIGAYCVEGFQIGFEDLSDGTVFNGIQTSLDQISTASVQIGAGNGRGTSYNQTININQQIDTADELARAIRTESRRGLMIGLANG